MPAQRAVFTPQVVAGTDFTSSESQESSEGREVGFGGGGDEPPPQYPTAGERKFAARKWNENVKLFSSGLSSLGFGLFGVSFAQAVLKNPALLVMEPKWGWWLTAVGLHGFAHFTLRTELVRED